MVREVEHVDQITELSAAPRIDFFRVESLSNSLGPFFQEHDLTFMCRMLCKDTTITRPRRDSVEGHAESRACRHLALLLVIRIRYPLFLSVLRRQGTYNVVGKTACFIIGVEENRRVPVLSIHDGVGNLGLNPLTVLGCIWRVLRKLHRGHQVRHFRKSTFPCILHKPVNANK